MSENQILSPKSACVLKILRTNKVYTRIVPFLLKWGEIVNRDDYEFGFLDLIGLEEQVELATEFLKRTEKNWQREISIDNCDDDFTTFFYKKAVKENIKLPDDFIKLMEDK